jgi:peptidyl-dipeptidase A
MVTNFTKKIVPVSFFIFLSACGGHSNMPAPTAADAQKFIDDVNASVLKLATDQQQAEWVAENFITDDTEAMAAAG